MSTDTVTTKGAPRSFKALLEKKKRNTNIGATSVEAQPPPSKKVKHSTLVSASATSSLSKGKKVLSGSPLDLDLDLENFSWPLLEELSAPKFEERDGGLEPVELLETMSSQIFQVFQGCLTAEYNASTVDTTLKLAWDEAKKAKTDAEALKKELDRIKVEVIDAKAEASKEWALRADLESELARIKAVAMEVATFYSWRVRVEAVEEHFRGESKRWNLENERKQFKAAYPDGPPKLWDEEEEEEDYAQSENASGVAEHVEDVCTTAEEKTT